jgi:aminopeptidase YwaD
MRQSVLLLFLILFALIRSAAQDLSYARSLIDTLSSPAMEGRGYVRNGDGKAADFLVSEFRKAGLQSLGDAYRQTYFFPMNTFPGIVEACIDGRLLKAGTDFQIGAGTPPVHGTFKVVRLTPDILMNARKLRKFCSHDYWGKMILTDKKGISDKKALAFLDSLRYTNFLKAAGILNIIDTKPVGSVQAGSRVWNYILADVRRDVVPERFRTFSLDVESEFISRHKAFNVMGWISGAVQPDTFLVFTAHYDHLGRMGPVLYPGANDNASGTVMVTDLARYYALPEHRPYYSVAFILLSGEEAGLLGSEYCAAHPPLDLKAVKFLLNIDMVGTGSDGITMVNATRYPAEFGRMTSLNDSRQYLAAVKSRGESCNSDHCPFYQRGVPSAFIYSLGKEFTEYHNPDDRSAQLPLTAYDSIFRLVRDFMDGFAPGVR